MNKIKFSLEQVITKDKIVLDGLIAEPARKSRQALIWIHGHTSKFYSGQQRIHELAQFCRKANIALVIFNNRGHDVITHLLKKNSKRARGFSTILSGGNVEKFTDCLFDIQAVIQLVSKLGYKQIYLAGHSTGANKILYYMYKIRDKRIKGLGLIAPVSDVAARKKQLGKQFDRELKEVKTLWRKNKNNFLSSRLSDQPMTAARYISLYNPGSAEDVFPYYNPQSKAWELASIRIPLLVMLGERDEYLDQSAYKTMHWFKIKSVKTRKFTGIVLPKAWHSFVKQEALLARSIISWIKKI
ncbi:MAG: alpha/beta fold hydrolase [Patescibacteria group bacterium]